MADDSRSSRGGSAVGWWPAVLWSLLAAVLLLAPADRVPQPAADWLDKPVHLLLFAVECALLVRLPWRPGPRRRVVVTAVLLAGGYAALLEAGQLAVPGRFWSWWDLFAGWLGVALAAVLVRPRRGSLRPSS